jgi:hypothetical protein
LVQTDNKRFGGRSSHIGSTAIRAFGDRIAIGAMIADFAVLNDRAEHADQII